METTLFMVKICCPLHDRDTRIDRSQPKVKATKNFPLFLFPKMTTASIRFTLFVNITKRLRELYAGLIKVEKIRCLERNSASLF
jgi:hypothetical protein